MDINVLLFVVSVVMDVCYNKIIEVIDVCYYKGRSGSVCVLLGLLVMDVCYY